MTIVKDRNNILSDIRTATEEGARQSTACKIAGISDRTLQRWRNDKKGDKRPDAERQHPKALTEEEKENIVKTCNQPEYADLPPGQIVPILAENGQYLASESSFYKVLKEKGQLKHRSNSKKPIKHERPKECVADGPGQVVSWDITYLRTNVKGIFFYLYLFLDVWSRRIIEWSIETEEDSEIAAEMVRGFSHELCEGYVVLHSDNGGPMRSGTMLATLHNLGVTPSFSRPRVSNDNPYSESLFKTLKYRAGYPKSFKTIEQAKDWVSGFVEWYNNEHRHSGINFVTPNQRHNGEDIAILEKRKKVYEEAKKQRPERWVGKTRNWNYQEIVVLNKEPGELKVQKIA